MGRELEREETRVQRSIRTGVLQSRRTVLLRYPGTLFAGG